ncbi:MAG: DNA helicase II [Gammaproteobacteria bacterium]|nr:MAG: DNA helicase II [Gammaproteobacteria bacterium]
MDVSHILEPLNDAQREAVSAPDGHYLVLAGAGSGKTRVLMHRIAWLIEVQNVSPFGVLAVTFTNKAAGEMRARAEELLSQPTRGMWIGTFHGIAHRLLRMHWQEAGLPQNFQILDSQDQFRLVRRVLRLLELDENQYSAKQTQWFINARKDEGQRPDSLEDRDDPTLRTLINVYQSYEEHCRRAGLVDFAELLLRAHEIWLEYPRMLADYRERFRHILVDEFQDTNTIQYAWLRLLAGDTGHVFVVGDDDQSIYGWRGARVENVQRFSKDFPDVTLYRLEQNYRSTGRILDAANALIANNMKRLGKKLWTAAGDGEPLQLYAAFNEQDEARFVVERIEQWLEEDNKGEDVAILYRSHAQSRVLEEALLMQRIPYRVYGGLRFFERAEIKDALAYLRLMANRDDDAAFERVVNTPTRGIGERTLDTIRKTAKENKLSLWRAAAACLADKRLTPRATSAVDGFMGLIHKMEGEAKSKPLHEKVDLITAMSGLVESYKKEPAERAETRIENLDELVSAARGFVRNEDDDMDELSAFLSHAALEAGEGQGGTGEDCVQLMTLHSAKGLEFPLLFMTGLEEGLFPHRMSIEEPGRLEEERRLCYVGITRARQHLYMCYAESRRLHGVDAYTRPSRFLREIPDHLTEEIRPRVQVSRPVSQAMPARRRAAFADDSPAGLKLGQRVSHATFGEGIVLNYEGEGSHARVQVNFEGAGMKWLVVAYANLETI